MSLDELFAAVFAVVAFVYLLVALLRPERL
jgi:K+-transporting ATPase KdpF subunit